MRQHAGWLVAGALVCFILAGSAVSGPSTPNQVDGCVYNATPPSAADGQVLPIQCTTDGKMQVNASVSATITNPTIGAAVPATANYIAGNKGGLLTGLTLDGSSNLNINCVVGCSGGTFNNNADAVATSATNGQTAAWLYGFNGTTWDRLRVDGSKNLQVSINASSATVGSNITQTNSNALVNDAAAAGTTAPLPVGGVYNSTLPTYTNGQRTQQQYGTRGAANVTLFTPDSTGSIGLTSAFADDAANNVNRLPVQNYSMVFDGSTWDRTYEVTNGMNSTGTGIQVVGNAAQCDDTSPTSTTENSFFNLRGGCTDHSLLAGALKAGVTTGLLMGSQTSANSLSVTIASDYGLAAGSTTSGQLGSIVMGAVTTSAPSYTTAQSNFLSLNTSGGLRVDGSGVTQPVSISGNQAVNVAQINGVTPLMGNGTTGTGSHRVTIASDNSAVSGMGVGATGSAVPANAVYQGANIGGNTTGLISCQSSVIYDASTNGSTELVALTSSQSVYICGYSIFAAGTVNVELDYGTGTACATGTTKITPAFQLTTQTGIVDGSPYYRGAKTAASNALCLKTSAGVAVQGIVYYTKF